MQRREFAAYADPLDILRRFAPAPLKAMYRIGSSRAVVQTNDFHLLPALPLDVNFRVPGEQSQEWKLIRDPDTPGPLEAARFLICGPLTVVEMGPACLLALDHERREVVGFIGADVDARTYQEFLVPLLCRLTQEPVPASPLPASANLRERSAHD